MLPWGLHLRQGPGNIKTLFNLKKPVGFGRMWPVYYDGCLE